MNDPAPDQELRDKLAALPRGIPPARDLWPGIRSAVERAAQRAQEGPAAVDHLADQALARSRPLHPLIVPIGLAATVALAALLLWPSPARREPAVGWTVAPLAGTPRIGRTALTTTGEWRVGDWLETDADSRAQLDIGRIGEVRLEPNSRLRLVSTAAADHRLELARGALSAFIWAPPRLFFVETPSATAIDLGCAYTLEVDDAGAGTLHVTSGYVALAHGDRESIIPAGLMCVTRPGTGPGTPFVADAPAELRTALAQFDFASDGTAALDEVLAAAGAHDRITL